MTTAHRPTWKAAVGKASEGGWSAGGANSGAIATLNLPSHTKLKFRSGSQVVDRKKALRESLKKLQQAESKSAWSKHKQRAVDPELEKEGDIKLLKQTADIDEKAIKSKYNDDDASDDDDDGSGGGGGGWNDDDSKDSDDLDASDSDDDSDDSDSDDEDDEAALQAELAKIRAERAAKKAQEDAKNAEEENAKLEEAAILGNPLLASDQEGGAAATGRMKRKWNDDVVFRNQAKSEPEVQKRFINDTVRNDFHKRFLNKFIR
mmetsp:Transcript_20752/g.59165  ORF Transcript_20752/g.59165 Transcript_20752/m.59165 type:complete len:262 (-) Transcript_20752:145-930(-)|eukprot:CAMPEP_0119547182 /NCGR_PEP_ID=MMETSP1352-20130426/1374_1 /TAXON_ID=265584 /ORGANISM="Stauroneis constricta, Strain CCMP1120" /LENGTH=261 /DNA_ID=CAMNT_0007592039 /DNA_START=85 /DNA_END=870 /DNA_ORIENTATION=+